MTTREPSPLGEDFDRTVRNLFRPISPTPPPSGRLRMAVLYSADFGLTESLKDVGLEVVYDCQPESAGIPDFEQIPEFDLLIVEMFQTGYKWRTVFRYAMRFLRVRRPFVFIVAVGERPSDELLAHVREQTGPLGYTAGADDTGLILGGTGIDPFAWPTLSLSELTADAVLKGVAEYLEGENV